MTAETELNLTGAAFDLANAGYTAMPDPKHEEAADAIGSDSVSLRDAADQRSIPQDEVVVRQYTDASGKPAARQEAITLDRASRDYASATAAERLTAQDQSSEALAARIDALRAEALASDPDAAEFYGFDPPETNFRGEDEAENEATNEAARSAEDRSAELDPDLEQLMQHPQVRLALEEKVGEVERARRDYVDGLATAMQLAQASFVSQFPELAGIAPEQLPAALEQMSRQDPARLARIQAMVAASEQLSTRQQQEMRHQAEAARHHFQNYAQAEDARLEAMLKGEPKDVRRAVVTEIMASARESGIDPNELTRLFNSEPLMRNATFQRMMYDAGKYRLMMKAKDAVAARPVPPVVRPGMALTRSERDHSDMRVLSARLSNSGDIKDAVALYRARKSGRQ